MKYNIRNESTEYCWETEAKKYRRKKLFAILSLQTLHALMIITTRSDWKAFIESLLISLKVFLLYSPYNNNCAVLPLLWLQIWLQFCLSLCFIFNFSQIVFCHTFRIYIQLSMNWGNCLFVKPLQQYFYWDLELKIAFIPMLLDFVLEPNSRKRLKTWDVMNGKNLFSIIEITGIWRQSTLQFVLILFYSTKQNLIQTFFMQPFHSFLSFLSNFLYS